MKETHDQKGKLCCLLNSEVCGKCSKKIGCILHYTGSEYEDRKKICWPCRFKVVTAG